MAGFSKAHGDSLPVVNVDIPEGGYTSVDTVINLAGPKLDFFSINLDADASGELGTGGAIESVISTINQLATVYMYQISQGANDGEVMSLAVYPTGAWTASDLQTAIRDLGTVSGFDLSLVNVENHGLRLLNDNFC
jgi:hypothetical protein